MGTTQMDGDAYAALVQDLHTKVMPLVGPLAKTFGDEPVMNSTESCIRMWRSLLSPLIQKWGKDTHCALKRSVHVRKLRLPFLGDIGRYGKRRAARTSRNALEIYRKLSDPQWDSFISECTDFLIDACRL